MKEFGKKRKPRLPEEQRLLRDKTDVANTEPSSGHEFLRAVLDRLQQTQGNAYVQRLVSGLHREEHLDPAAQSESGPLLGSTLTGVHLHTDAAAAAEAERLGARAFTRGEDIYFNAGEYAPATTDGQKLLAHELAHVLQQSRGGPASSSDAIEKEAENAETCLAAGKAINIEHSAGSGVHKKEKKEEPSVARHPVEIVPVPPNGVISAAGHFSVAYSFGTGDPIVLTLQVPSGVSVAATPFADIEPGEYRVNDSGAGGARSVTIVASPHHSPARLQVAFVHGSSTYLVVFQFLKASHPPAHSGGGKH